MEGAQVRELPAGRGSLAHGVPHAAPGTLHVLGPGGGVRVAPGTGAKITFGRHRDHVDVPVGEDDRRVSRRHGALEDWGDGWHLRALGKVPIRLPGSRLLFTEMEPYALCPGYLPMFVRGTGGRDHVLEVLVTGHRGDNPSQPLTLPARERLALTVVCQRYLRYESSPRPLSWRRAAVHLRELQPHGGWTAAEVEHVVTGVRDRMAIDGAGTDWLSRELLAGAVVTPRELALLAPPARGHRHSVNQPTTQP